MDEISFNPADPNDLFELVELLGEGSYGAVYKATHKADPSRPPVAVKIIPADVSTPSHRALRVRCCARSHPLHYLVPWFPCA